MPLERLLASLQEPSLRDVARFWAEIRADRRFPAWRDIDPVALAPHLPILWGWRWDKALQTFVGRLAGEAILDALGPGFRGCRIEDYFAGRHAEIFTARYRRVLEEPAILATSGFAFSLNGNKGIGERVVLPLAEDGEHPDGLVGATIYRAADRRLARARVTMSPERENVMFFPV